MSPRFEVEIFITTSSFEVNGYGQDARTQTVRYLGWGVSPVLPNPRVVPSKRQGFGFFDRCDMGVRFLIYNFLHIDGSVHDQFDIQWYYDTIVTVIRRFR